MKSNKDIRGRMCMVRDTKTGNSIVEALVVDAGVRLQTGEHFGEKRRNGEYQLLELIEPRDVKTEVIGEAWGE